MIIILYKLLIINHLNIQRFWLFYTFYFCIQKYAFSNINLINSHDKIMFKVMIDLYVFKNYIIKYDIDRYIDINN